MDIRMKYDLRWFYSLLLLISYPVFAQNYTISGFIEDFETGEKLINANIYSSETQKGTISNNYGFYSITLPARNIRIHYSYVGYKGITREFLLNKDTLINIALETSNLLEEIEVRANSIQSDVESSRMSMNRIPVETIKGLPVLLGEIDIIKTIQLLPGVQSGAEGTSGFYVRGGSPDQNLILLDEVPVYNANHLFGFFSVFNNDAINTVNLTKGAFPARYGGRLSSVLDIRMKEGNKSRIKGSGSVGIISSKLTLDGPVNDKTTFLISGRRTYIDLLAQPLIKYSTQNDYDKFKAGYYFYDLNAKMNHTFSNKSRLYLSTYLGKDKAYMTSEETDVAYYDKIKFGLGWGNITTALRWNYLFNDRLFSNTTITFSRYKFLTKVNEAHSFEENTPVEEFSFTYSSGIKDFAGKIDFDYIPSTNHYIKFGTNIIQHTFNPGVAAYYVSGINGSTENVDTTFGNKKIIADEFSAYIEDDLKISRRFKANLGLHFSGFMVENKFYNSLQFRFSARYLLNEKWSVKGAYSEMTQYIHLLTNASVGLPT
ncbi:MAG: TonB-dependent receptor, partial [Bacteroidales bacterium]|nr:TonB-dependent receptor [Bacteroidales bacterium]